MKEAARKFLRVSAASALHYGGALVLARMLRPRRPGETLVLGLHRVLNREELADANSLPSIVLREDVFAQLLEGLRRHFRVVSLDEFLDGRSTGGKPRCLITFDDGWRDNYTTAFPWLKRLGLPAVIFLATGLLESGGTFWVEQVTAACRDARRLSVLCQALGTTPERITTTLALQELVEQLKHMPEGKRRALLEPVLAGAAGDYDGDQMLTWEQVREMAASGIEFGGHSDSHPLLPYEDDAAIEREVRICKQKIEAALGRRVRAFAYPNGDWDERVKRMVERAGYDCAFTTLEGWHRPVDDTYAIRRVLLHDGCLTGLTGGFSPAVFTYHLRGWR